MMRSKLIFYFMLLSATQIFADVPVGLFGGGSSRGDSQLFLPYMQLNGNAGGMGDAQLNFVLQPADGAINAQFDVSLALTNGSGRRITSATNSITLAPLGGAGALIGTNTKATDKGYVYFSNLNLNATGVYQLTANATGLDQTISSIFYMADKAFTNNNGAGMHNWSDEVNWTGNSLPGTNEIALVKDYAIIGGAVTVKQLIISSIPGSRVDLIFNTQLTITESLINNAGTSGLRLYSEARGSASIIHSSPNVQATVQMAIPGEADKWHMISSPVDAQSASGAFMQDGHLFAWSEGAQSWVKSGVTQGYPTWAQLNNGHDNFIPAKGYIIKYNVAAPLRTFIGNLNQGTQSFTLELASKTKDLYHGYQVVGNPYQSAIDWNATEGWDRSKLEVSGGGNTYWTWNPDAGNYGSFISGGADGSGTNGATRYLAPNQAFWVRAIAAGNLTMNNSVRVHSNTTLLKAAEINNHLLLKVSGNANTYSDEALISLGNNDNTGGAMKMFSLYETAPSLYTVKSELNYSINLLADVPKQPVAVAFKAGAAGNYTIEATGGLLSKNVVLEDLQTGQRTMLTIENSYRFNSSTTDNPNRFLLHFGSTTAAEKNIPTGLLATFNNGSLSILNPYSGISRADLYDVSGRLISSYQLNQTGNQQFNIELSLTGVYLIRIGNNKERMSGKLLVRD